MVRHDSLALKVFAMLESAIQSKIIEKVEAKGCLAIKIMRANKNGIPDLCILTPNGRVVFIEVKKPGGIASKLQEYYIGFIRKLGIPAAICYSWEDAVAMVDKLMNPKTPH